MVFYRKYRPQTFADMVGQDQVRSALQAAIATGTLSHALLFCGPRGCGKTTTARLVAKAINCGEVHSSQSTVHSQKAANREPITVSSIIEPCNECSSCLAITNGSHMDVIEIDAASNRGIDDIRSLQERVYLAPTQGKKKVYIIDEVHMLTTEAFNALLKTLEEPPAHVIFILATTDPNKLPQTILSRTMRFNFSLASDDDLLKALQKVADQEQVSVDELTLRSLIVYAQGSFRDGIKLFDQLVSSGTITADTIASLFKAPQEVVVDQFITALATKDTATALATVGQLASQGEDLTQFVVVVLKTLRKQLLATMTKDAPKTPLKSADLVQLLKLFAQAEREMKQTSLTTLPIELAVMEWGGAAEGLGARIQGLDEKQKTQPSPEPLPQPLAEEIAATNNDIAPEDIGAMLAEESDNIAIAEPEEIKEEVAQVETPQETPQATGDLPFITQKWPKFIAHVVENNASVALLVKNAKVAQFDGQRLLLEVVYKFHKERLENEKLRKLAEQSLQEVYGVPIRIDCVVKERAKAEPKPEVFEDEEVLEVFGGEVLD